MAEDEKYDLPSIDEAPWLIGIHEKKKVKSAFEKQTFFSMNNNTSYVKRIVELQGKTIVGSSVGWFILRERVNDTMYSLWNPITRQSILLPELPVRRYRYPGWCMLTSPPYEDGFDNGMTKCVVLFIFSGAVFSCRITSKRDDYRWVEQDLTYRGRSAQLYRAAVVNGDIYAIADMYDDEKYKTIFDREDDDEVDNDDNDGTDNEDDDGTDNDDDYGTDNEDDDGTDNEDDDGTDNDDDDDDNSFCVRLKVSDDGSSTSVLIEQLSVGYPLSFVNPRSYVYYLVEICGELYSVNIVALRVFVSRWDMPKREWIQVESLGDRAILLGSQCCTWCWAYESHGRIEGNCIYVAEPKTNIIDQYRLQDNSYTFVSSYSDFGFCSQGPIWFMPRNPTRFSSLMKEAEQSIVENTKHIELREETSAEIPASLLLQLPSEILISIADRMHWFDCMNFRATCKIMRSQVPKPQLKANSPFPLFLSLSNTQGICELWDPCYQNNGSITTKLPYSPSIVSTIEFCKDGWLILRSHEGCYLQYMNIFTGERGKYPTKSLPSFLVGFGFSTCPSSPDCITVGINCLRIGLLQAGDDKWKVRQFEFEDGDDGLRGFYQSSPKYHDGAFYFLSKNSELGVLKLINGEWDLKTHKGPLQNDNSSKLDECYIAELDGQIVCIFIQAFGYGIQVYSFDINQTLWVELKSLGDYTLFVSAASSLSVPTKDSSMRNRIYLPNRIGNEMVFYSLDTRKYHTSSSKDSFENFRGMKLQSFCCWV